MIKLTKDPKMKSLKIEVLLHLVCVSLLTSLANAATLPQTPKLLPQETILLLQTESFSELLMQFEKTAYYKLYKDPAMAAFVQNVKNKWRFLKRPMLIGR